MLIMDTSNVTNVPESTKGNFLLRVIFSRNTLLCFQCQMSSECSFRFICLKITDYSLFREGQNFFITVQEKLQSRRAKFSGQQVQQQPQMTVPRARVQPQPQVIVPSAKENSKKAKTNKKNKKISIADISGSIMFDIILASLEIFRTHWL